MYDDVYGTVLNEMAAPILLDSFLSSSDGLGEASGYAGETHVARIAGDPELLRVVSGRHPARN